VFDVLFRLLKHIYPDKEIRYIRNITDVDDKINARAARDYPGLPLNEAIAKVTEATERQFHDDVAALGCLQPTEEPRATQYIETMRMMIDRLVDRGVAYVAEDHVLFSPNAMDALPWAPRYGTLAHRSLDEMLAGARVDVAPYKHDPMDFVLWKPSKPNEPGWPSPAGIAAPGRPGWHIECSAMSMATLLEPFGGGFSCVDPNRNAFDIHGGGIDLVFPHHENEIAQSCCAFGSARMANVWMHNGFLQVEGEKMSKSLGNFVTIRELLRGWKGEAWSGAAIRYAMLSTHYRRPIDWTLERLTQAKANIQIVAEYTAPGDFASRPDYEEAWTSKTIDPSADLVSALSDDLNTPYALSHINTLISKISSLDSQQRIGLVHDLRFLGVFTDANQADADQRKWLTGTHTVRGMPKDLRIPAWRAFEDYRVGSANRDRELVESKRLWFEMNHIDIVDSDTITYRDDSRESVENLAEKLIAERKAARERKDWKESDRLRDELSALGVALQDNKNGTTTWTYKR